MTLADRLGLGSRELVAVVGAGGKTSLVLALAWEAASSDGRLVVTTTTKMGADQLPSWMDLCFTLEEVATAIGRGRPAFLVGDVAASKITGVPPALVDRIFETGLADCVVAEADGARRKLLKAPAPHEPVIPAAATVVVVVASLAAIGRRIREVAHRPDRVAALLGVSVDHVVRPIDLAGLLKAPAGGLLGVPGPARVVVALTSVTFIGGGGDAEIREALEPEPRIERVVTIDLEGLDRGPD